jgi:tRNA A-37 threonylcarbamoyl transferase component Bud32
MDRIVGHDMRDEIFQEEDLARVRRAMNLLHENDYVFGDLRPSNIFKPTDGTRVVLVDFGLCGQDGVGRYPPFRNQEFGYHPDVRG